MHIPVLALLLALHNAPTDAEVERDTAAWHEKRVEKLRAEDGWLTLVGLFWLEPGAQSAGSKPDNKLVFPSPAPPKLGVFTLEGKQVTFQPEKGVSVTLEGRPFTGGALQSDAQESPSVLQVGTLRFHVIERGARVGLRVKDTEAPARKAFRGIARYPARAAWRVEAQLIPAREERKLNVPTVLGTIEPMTSPGTLRFSLKGKSVELTPVTEEGSDSLFIIFADPTNRSETYGAGRFLYAPKPVNGKVTLDFNQAFNPPCAFSKFATCPLPPKGNRLPVSVEAGEKRYGDH